MLCKICIASLVNFLLKEVLFHVVLLKVVLINSAIFSVPHTHFHMIVKSHIILTLPFCLLIITLWPSYLVRTPCKGVYWISSQFIYTLINAFTSNNAVSHIYIYIHKVQGNQIEVKHTYIHKEYAWFDSIFFFITFRLVHPFLPLKGSGQI